MSRKNVLETTEIIEATEADAPVRTEQTEQAVAAAAPAERAEPVIYCGPNIPKGNLLSMAVFRGGIPGNIRRLTEKIPEISGLIVPVSRLAGVRKKIAVQGSEENRLNQVILTAREGI